MILKRISKCVCTFLMISACSGILHFVDAINIGRGAVSEDVKHIQELLINQGYLVDNADGIFGNNTAYSIKAFQKDQVLPVTGTVDDHTLARLEEKNKAFEKEARTNGIQRGAINDTVKHVQSLLINQGYLIDKADGVFGNNTEYALKSFQKDKNLFVNGIIDNKTLAALEVNNRRFIQKNTHQVETKKRAKKKEIQSVDTKSISTQGKKREYIKGDRGLELRELQAKLSSNGFSTNGADGIFGDGTFMAVKRFQKAYGLNVTGKIDLHTKDKIYALPYKPKKYKKKLVVEASAYSAEDIGNSSVTANGHRLQRGYIAVDPTVIPLGTEVYVEGYGYAIADDIGGNIKGNRIDVAMDSYDEAIQFGRRETVVYILS